MKVLDLFSGIGGFSLGLERAGMETVAFCEIEEYPRKILKKHWPHVPIFEDVRKLKGEQLGAIDVICGGFPCQPFSVAGKQRGKNDDRHLWPEMFRLLQETRPRWLIGENVAGFITMALDDVLSDLESEGYTCQTFIIPACAVGGIHRRDRVWIVANTEHYGALTTEKSGSKRPPIFDNQKREDKTGKFERVCSSSNVADSSSLGQSRQGSHGQPIDTKASQEKETDNAFNDVSGYIRTPTEPSIRHRNDGLPENVARLKALGNAVVPQIPELIGRAIMQVEDLA